MIKFKLENFFDLHMKYCILLLLLSLTQTGCLYDKNLGYGHLKIKPTNKELVFK